MTLGESIDKLYQARAARLVKAKEVKDLQAAEAAAKLEVLRLLEEAGLEKASGKLATAGILKSDIPIISNWDALYAYITATGKFELLQKRIGVTAWRELYQDGILVDGTEAGVDNDLSLTKSTRN